MATTVQDAKKSMTGRVKADKARIDRLKEQLRSTRALSAVTRPVVLAFASCVVVAIC